VSLLGSLGLANKGERRLNASFRNFRIQLKRRVLPLGDRSSRLRQNGLRGRCSTTELRRCGEKLQLEHGGAQGKAVRGSGSIFFPLLVVEISWLFYDNLRKLTPGPLRDGDVCVSIRSLCEDGRGAFSFGFAFPPRRFCNWSGGVCFLPWREMFQSAK